jgi:hypothetical protein
MLEAIDKKNVTAVVLLDMSKAIDSVSHPILLHKLKCVGASSQAVGWFKSYLSGRRQYVRIGSTVSSVLPLSHGVPQGTILYNETRLLIEKIFEMRCKQVCIYILGSFT